MIKKVLMIVLLDIKVEVNDGWKPRCAKSATAPVRVSGRLKRADIELLALQPSATRPTTLARYDPSSELLGYYQSSAADWKTT
jgi:hypothetical protein